MRHPAAVDVARLTDAEALALADSAHALASLDELMARARAVRDAARGALVTYSPKVFIPLTQLCRDVCHYCTFAQPPKRGQKAFMTREEVLAVARAGAEAGCHEALFTLGDKPELRYRAAREELAELGFPTTAAYLAHCARAVLEQTGLLPHANPGILADDEWLALREVCPSQGIMLETASERLSTRGLPHFGSPDKLPSVRLDALDRMGRLRIPTTSGILIGIGETRRERVEALLALRDLHAAHGHVQEVIVQNFRAKDGTRMAAAPEPSAEEHLWTIAVARLLLPSDVVLQAPPNLQEDFGRLLDAGIDDWGGVSPLTPDHVNPERPWPEVERLAEVTASRGKTLAPRLTVHPRYATLDARETWLAPATRRAVLAAADGRLLARPGDWRTGTSPAPPPAWRAGRPLLVGGSGARFRRALDRATDGHRLDEGGRVDAPRRARPGDRGALPRGGRAARAGERR